MNNPERISGIVDRFIYQNTDSGYSVFVVTTDTTSVVATGSVPSLQAGHSVDLYGTWSEHPKFGKQFALSHYSLKLPTTSTGLIAYLGSGAIRGIGVLYAKRLVDHFGTAVLSVIEESPERLREVAGIGEKRALQITNSWKEQREVAHLMAFLQDRGISPALALKIYRQYGAGSISVLHSNPYRLAYELWGVGFKTADGVAQKMGFGPTAPQRLEAGILHTIEIASSSGHLYLRLDEARTKTLELLMLSPDQNDLLKRPLHTLHERREIFVLTHGETHYLTNRRNIHAEVGVAKKILLLLTATPRALCDVHTIYQTLRSSTNITLSDQQITGIITALSNTITIITGGPGTGKTTLVRSLLSILDAKKISYLLAAPTGRATKRMMESTGRYAATIHRLLEFDPISRAFKHTEHNALSTDVLIIDEASMIDIFLAHSLLKAIAHGTRVIFIGDVDQLPSVGAGDFLTDLIQSKQIPTLRLTTIFRQAQDSLIVLNAHRVNHGEFPTAKVPGTRNDFIFIAENSPEKTIAHIERILKKELPRRGIAIDQTQVLVPMNKGQAGTIALNEGLQKLLNGKHADTGVLIGHTRYHEGDRIMQIRNNYDKNVFNGDIGTVQKIDQQEKELFVIFGDRIVTYEFHECEELVLAYAITIHKSQGSEYGAVIIPIFTHHFTLLQRSLIYTAITRAKKLCVIVGQPRAIAIGVRTINSLGRCTFLQEFISATLALPTL
jgi:exodeoxyribonuclease V alpha subunit